MASDPAKCFNCNQPGNACYNGGVCTSQSTVCNCPSGLAGQDCATLLCGSLVKPNIERPLRKDKDCECDDGWSGVNCNVCQKDSVCASISYASGDMRCLKSDVRPIFQSFGDCKVTNRIIQQQGNFRGSFSTDRETKTALFQLFMENKEKKLLEESFYCSLSKCHEATGKTDTETSYACDEIHCDCLPNAPLCGRNGLDIGGILRNTIRGPGQIVCGLPSRASISVEPFDEHSLWCNFEEPQLNGIIKGLTGDEMLFLSCNLGQCVDSRTVPPILPKDGSTLLSAGTFISVGSSLLIALFCYIFFKVLLGVIMKSSTSEFEKYRCAREDPPAVSTAESPLLADTDNDSDSSGAARALPSQIHASVSLAFRDVFYTIQSRNRPQNQSIRTEEANILTSVHGVARPGRLLAIMGASGAGKSSLLDVLAARQKTGTVSGNIYVSGHQLTRSHMKSVVGYVDQEDLLIPTLTVQETILYAGLLRLPASMSNREKYERVYQTMAELDILRIAKKLIGSPSHRGISGGERRRVSIACEMVTAPSILLLDEPTSGLDAYNALNVIECVSRLARDYNHTIALTIHQPRHNIFELFDDLLVLSHGQVVYSGPTADASNHFAFLGYVCPPGHNLADYIIDLAASSDISNDALDSGSMSSLETGEFDAFEQSDENLVPGRRRSRKDKPIRRNRIHDIRGTPPMVGKISAFLVSKYLTSEAYTKVNSLLDEATQPQVDAMPQQYDLDSVGARKSPGATLRFLVLAERTFKSVFRDAYLLSTHVLTSLGAAIAASFIFYDLDFTVSGYQTRLGFLFFSCALFMFMSLSLLNYFASERPVFIRERANRYYSPFIYFLSKFMFVIVPISIVPSMIFAFIAYYPVGLVFALTEFFKYCLVLILFTLNSATTMFCISVTIADIGVANLFASIYILFSLLFISIFERQNGGFSIVTLMGKLFFFGRAFEALAANEIRRLSFWDHKNGINLQIPGAALMSTMGMDVMSYWKQAISLCVFLGSVLVLSFMMLHFRVRERR